MKKITPATSEIIHSITCDKCGKEYHNLFETEEFLEISFIGGYISVFGDGNLVECDICQHCLYEMIKEFCRIGE